MSKNMVVCLVAGMVLLLFTAMVAGALDRRDWMRDIDRAPYNVASEKIYEGTVASKGHVVDGLVYFALRTAGTTVQVQIGPEAFVERSGLALNIGAMVTAVGVPVLWNGRSIVLAREVRTMTSVLLVRDDEGYPLWETNQMDPERLPSPLCEMIHR